jgi:hypothetical protein
MAKLLYDVGGLVDARLKETNMIAWDLPAN